ncbi:ATP-binding protein [Vibrio vulnificus]|uniref:Uncharacterized protein n=1 Tax=Vibrio vulnificus (strain CMCP6) TaxID=216895 RepID=A0A3Q0MFF2_VIBVU|nr:AAA-like domain-containing protein [Vibrio vulnificus]ADV91923.1 hypothetical protein VV1_3208 [Vibrio vulnificus CMCP6]QBN13188.1 hypothetical protein E2I22_02675 [Vibrio vulnificus]
MTKKLISETIIPRELYIERDADRQIEQIVNDMGRPGYILVSRQMGKTNLLIHTKRKLETENDIFAYIDLSNRFDTARECFRSIIDTIIESNYEKLEDIEEEIENRRNNRKIPSHKEHGFEIRKILNKISGKLIINLDEIDSLTSSDYSDKIFAHIRSVYFERVNFPELKRLTYVISGVAEPSEIIKDKSISPFNIGQKIFLTDFSLSEFRLFVEKSKLELNDIVIERIYYWIQGNPRMSWEVLSTIEDKVKAGINIDVDSINSVIKDLYLSNYDRPPIDHIRVLASADKDLQSGLFSMHYNKPVSDHIRSKLYLAGIAAPSEADESVAFKNRVVEASLSETWLSSLSLNSYVSIDSTLELFNKKEYIAAEKQFLTLIESEINDEMLDFIRYKLAACTLFNAKYTDTIKYCKLLKDVEKIDQREVSWMLGFSFFKTNSIEPAIEELSILVSGEELDSLKYRATVDYCLALLKSNNNHTDEIIRLCKSIIQELSISVENEPLIDIKNSIMEVLYIASMILQELDNMNSERHIDSACQYAVGLDVIVPSIMRYEKDEDCDLFWDSIFLKVNESEKIHTSNKNSNPYLLKDTHIKSFINLSQCLDDDRFLEYLKCIQKIIEQSESLNIDFFHNLIMCLVLDLQNKSKKERWISTLNFIKSLDREIIDPEFEFLCNKFSTYLEPQNEEARSLYFQGIQNYSSTPEIIDAEIFEREIIRLYDEGKDEQAISLSDLVHSLDVLSSTSTKVILIRIMYIRMIRSKNTDKKVSLAKELDNLLDKITVENVAHARLNMKEVDNIRKNVKGIIIKNTPIKQVIHERKYKRNELISVLYIENDTTEVGKYKKFINDLENGKCRII